jgi:hypothetical protein
MTVFIVGRDRDGKVRVFFTTDFMGRCEWIEVPLP